jgi:hypothetical protein
MSWVAPEFSETKAKFLRLAATVEKAHSKAQLRALLLADLSAPYHSFNALELVSKAENVVVEMVNSVLDDTDEDGAPA